MGAPLRLGRARISKHLRETQFDLQKKKKDPKQIIVVIVIIIIIDHDTHQEIKERISRGSDNSVSYQTNRLNPRTNNVSVALYSILLLLASE